jgi:hypothetical protein
MPLYWGQGYVLVYTEDLVKLVAPIQRRHWRGLDPVARIRLPWHYRWGKRTMKQKKKKMMMWKKRDREEDEPSPPPESP